MVLSTRKEAGLAMRHVPVEKVVFYVSMWQRIRTCSLTNGFTVCAIQGFKFWIEHTHRTLKLC